MLLMGDEAPGVKSAMAGSDGLPTNAKVNVKPDNNILLRARVVSECIDFRCLSSSLSCLMCRTEPTSQRTWSVQTTSLHLTMNNSQSLLFSPASYVHLLRPCHWSYSSIPLHTTTDEVILYEGHARLAMRLYMSTPSLESTSEPGEKDGSESINESGSTGGTEWNTRRCEDQDE